MTHIPVLLDEVITGLKVRAEGKYIDATVGDGGHTMEMLKTGATVLGIDRDPAAIERTKRRLKKEIKEGKLILMRSNFDKLQEVAAIFAPVSSLAKFADQVGVLSGSTPLRRPRLHVDRLRALERGSFDGILFDLGLRSGQLEEGGRGFSFQRDEPLDMRMDRDLAVTAADLVNGLGKRELFELFVKLGQVDRAGAVAEQIVRRRQEKPIKTTAELAGLVEKVLPRRGKLHPATKVFMALRMAVNDELGSLERALPQACELLVPGGRLAVISFHGGEDRIVKRFFRSGGSGSLAEVNKKPIRPGEEEIRMNPRARSAKLRIGVRSKE